MKLSKSYSSSCFIGANTCFCNFFVVELLFNRQFMCCKLFNLNSFCFRFVNGSINVKESCKELGIYICMVKMYMRVEAFLVLSPILASLETGSELSSRC
jgi:hypothetical protein